MFEENSPFFRLPDLPRRQMILIDGVRHAIEMAAVALSRLQDGLTEISLKSQPEPMSSRIYASAFVDAWATVSAIDRFHAIYRSLVKSSNPNSNDDLTIPELAPIRDLRNVDQHILGLVDKVVAEKGTALGILWWTTFLPPDHSTSIKGVLLPGTSFERKLVFPFDGGRYQGRHPTQEIVLEAGEHRADLVAAMTKAFSIAKGLEEQLANHVRDLPEKVAFNTADRFFAVSYVPVDVQHAPCFEGEHPPPQ